MCSVTDTSCKQQVLLVMRVGRIVSDSQNVKGDRRGSVRNVFLKGKIGILPFKKLFVDVIDKLVKVFNSKLKYRVVSFINLYFTI